MLAKILIYVLQFGCYSTILWLGFENAGKELPGPITTPWLWALVAIAPLVPWYWSCYDGEPSFWDGED